MSQPRHRRKHLLAQHNGEVVHVSRLLPAGGIVEYDAVLDLEMDVEGHAGRALLHRIKFLHACGRAGAYDLFLAAMDIPVKGFPGWFKISGHYARMDRYTEGRTYTRAVMDMLGYAPAA